MTVIYNMTPPVNDLPALLQSANSISNNISQAIAHTSTSLQTDVLYEMIRQKNLRVRNLRDHFKYIKNPKIYITEGIFDTVELQDNMEFFNVKDRNQTFENSIVLLSNNNVMVDNNLGRYISLWLQSPTSIFAIWDFDNHHWFPLASMLAATSDLYVPTHGDNLEPLSRYNLTMMGPVCSGVIQWSKKFLRENIEIITDTKRSDEPYGTHIRYPQFPYRLRILEELSKKMPMVQLVDDSYHKREKSDKLQQWCNHKVHWIVPVLNDAPIRIFDALITGGIPVVPRSLKYHRDIIDLHEHILFYDYEDVKNPLTISEKGVKIFNERGVDGIMKRHNIAIEKYHVDDRVNTILRGIYDEFKI